MAHHQQFDLATLDEQGVSTYFTSLGFPHYAEQIKEHGISGPILLHLDHTSLRDLGILSVGQRLAILRAVRGYKIRKGLPVVVATADEEEGEGDGFGAGGGGGVGGDLEEDLWWEERGGGAGGRGFQGMLGERDDRIHSLEVQVQKLHESLLALRDDISLSSSSRPGSSSTTATTITSSSLSKMTPRPQVRSPTFASTTNPSPSPTAASAAPSHPNPNPHPLSNQSTLSRSATSSPAFSSSRAPLSPSFLPGVGVGAGGGGESDSPRSPIMMVDSPRLGSGSGSSSQVHDPGYGTSTAYHHHSTGNQQGPVTPTTPTAPVVPAMGNSLTVPVSGTGTGSSSVGLGAPPPSSSHHSRERPRDISTTSTTTTSTTKDDEKTPKDKDTSTNPYRSFRVTVEDPCYKVLPAALKKYKINDDWRLYALFICYGNTERCLAYDEKPLLLFQRLKESNNNPVFMLRHIKDIKSPIAVASAKHAARRTAGEKRAVGVGAGTEERKTVNRDGVAVAGAGQARPTRLHHPPVLLPVGKDKEKGEKEGAENKKEEQHQVGPPPMSPREAPPGYCISIYPYLAEREDEFDVTVGDTFVIISKTKGWWVVHRDLGPSHQQDSTTPRKSAWVPAGCLLETSVPALSLAPPSLDVSSLPPGNAATVPIEPQFVVSVSTPNVALMDYERQGLDELDVRKGTGLRILKRYNHWSYAIKEDGQRGWIPSWFCGRTSRAGDGTPTTPTTAEGRAALSAPSNSTSTRDRSPSSASAAVGNNTTTAAAAVASSSIALGLDSAVGGGSAMTGPETSGGGGVVGF